MTDVKEALFFKTADLERELDSKRRPGRYGMDNDICGSFHKYGDPNIDPRIL